MIEPVAFGYNAETGIDNEFQNKPADGNASSIAFNARQEMLGVKRGLIEAGVNVISFSGQSDCPDDVFPNNWISTTPAKEMIVYPMATQSRGKERRADIVTWLGEQYKLLADFSAAETTGKALESTGVLIQDHMLKKVYVARSQRTDDALLKAWSRTTGYDVVSFDTQAPDTLKPVYHTNVICHIGTGYAAICPEVIVPKDRERVLKELSKDREIISLSFKQILSFCGNALEVTGKSGKKFLSLSDAAFQALTEQQRKQYETYVDGFISAPIPTIEKYGGGSVRCMMCELF